MSELVFPKKELLLPVWPELLVPTSTWTKRPWPQGQLLVETVETYEEWVARKTEEKMFPQKSWAQELRDLVKMRQFLDSYMSMGLGSRKGLSQVGAVTGRLSSSMPNLSNIPAPSSPPIAIKTVDVTGTPRKLSVTWVGEDEDWPKL